jgi:hypothetical protein
MSQTARREVLFPDAVFQLVPCREVHTVAALLIGPILTCFPYALSRALTTRLARFWGNARNNRAGAAIPWFFRSTAMIE